MMLVYHPLSCVINKRFNTLLKKKKTKKITQKLKKISPNCIPNKGLISRIQEGFLQPNKKKRQITQLKIGQKT